MKKLIAILAVALAAPIAFAADPAPAPVAATVTPTPAAAATPAKAPAQKGPIKKVSAKKRHHKHVVKTAAAEPAAKAAPTAK